MYSKRFAVVFVTPAALIPIPTPTIAETQSESVAAWVTGNVTVV